MHTFDFTPLFRSAIGFDRVASMLDAANRSDQNQQSYPPYNIELLAEDNYRITMAVAGFTSDELTIESKEGHLTVSGNSAEEDKKRKFLHRGIATRSFERRFQLADYVKVTAANVENGLLHIELVREVPEAMRTRKIEITTGSGPTLIEGEAAKVA